MNGVAAILKGRARFKFGGEEIAGKDGKPSWNKAVLAKYGFVEPITVTPEASKLKVSPKDLKSLPATDETVTNSNVDATSLY
jgi:hypothetical protein